MDIKKFIKNYEKRKKKKEQMINNIVIRIEDDRIVLNGSEMRKVINNPKLIDDLLNIVDEDVFRLIATKEE